MSFKTTKDMLNCTKTHKNEQNASSLQYFPCEMSGKTIQRFHDTLKNIVWTYTTRKRDMYTCKNDMHRYAKEACTHAKETCT